MAKEKINPRLEKENIKFNIIVSTDEYLSVNKFLNLQQRTI